MAKQKLTLTNGQTLEVDDERFSRLYIAVCQGQVKPDQLIRFDNHQLTWNDIDSAEQVEAGESLHDIFIRQGLRCWCRECYKTPSPSVARESKETR